MPSAMPKKYLAYGPGFSGDYDTREEAQEVLSNNRGEGDIYVRIDLMTDEDWLEWEREDHACMEES